MALFLGGLGGALVLLAAGCGVVMWLDRTKLPEGAAKAVAMLLAILGILGMILLREVVEMWR